MACGISRGQISFDLNDATGGNSFARSADQVSIQQRLGDRGWISGVKLAR
jgi:hypothetical protein